MAPDAEPRWGRVPELKPGFVLPAIEEEIDYFEERANRFRIGDETEDTFRLFRLAHGTYGQRQADEQMMRIKLPYGGVTADQMDVFAEIAETYSELGRGHITTRQNFQFHFVSLEDSPKVMRMIGKVGLTTREACAHTVRNITGCDHAGVSLTEVFDATPYVAAYGRYMIRNPIRPDVLDPALLRPGRFDRQVRLDPPDAAARRHILTLHARGKPFAEGVDLEAVIPQTTGLSGADLENLLNEAAILTARDGRTRIEMHDLEEALDRVTAGPRRKGRSLSERERKVTAVHELGHALVAHLLPEADPVQKVTIVSRGQMGGYTRMTPEEDRRMWSLPQFKAAMASALGGHVAEELAFGQVTTGASNDLKKAYNIA